MENKYLRSSDGETKIWRETCHEQQRPNIEAGILEPDIVVEDSIEIDCPQTESERMRRFIMKCIQNNPLRFRIIHDVFTIQNITFRDSNISRICEQGGSSGLSFKGTIFFVTNHGNDHLHVVHDCSYNGNSCRCQRVKEI